MECHMLPSLLGFGVGPSPQNKDKESTGVRCKYKAGQGVKDPKSGDHFACAILFSNAKCKHCVLATCAN